MALTIDGIPESISRADYVALIASLGLDPLRLTHLELRMNGVYAEVKAKNAEGRDFLDPFNKQSIAKHRVFIPVED